MRGKASYRDQRRDVALSNPQVNPVRLSTNKSRGNFLECSAFFFTWNDSLGFRISREMKIQQDT